MGQVKVEIKVNGATFREFYVDSAKTALTPVAESRCFTNACPVRNEISNGVNLNGDEETKLDKQIIIRLGREIIKRADSENE